MKCFLLSEPEELPILVASGFCGRAEAQLSEDCKRNDEKVFFSEGFKRKKKEHLTDIPFQLLVDLITEAYDVLPVLLPVCWMGGFICQRERDIYTMWCV